MDRIRAYVLRKFASTASLEVLRSPTYVEQVQEVIDRAAPIIKKKLEEIRRPREQRSRSVDLGWSDESFRQHIQEDRKRDNGDEEESKERRNGLAQGTDSAEQKETKSSLDRNGTLLKRKEKKQKKRSTGSSKRSKRRENDEIIDRIDDTSKNNDKSEYEPDESRDTLEARLTATQNILEGISKSTSELGGVHKSDSDEPLESDVTDHTNVVSLPIVRPPSSRNSRNTTKNDTDSLTLPPISPEVPKSMKKKDELSLPILSANHSTVKSQEQEISKDVEEASTMRDITSDIEDIAILPEDDHVILDMEDSESKDLIPDIKTFVDEETDANIIEIFRDDLSEKHDGRRESSEEFKELEEQLKREGEKVEEVFKDSLNVTPEMIDISPRPDSLEPDENEIKFDDDLIRGNRLDGLKDKLMEIEMVERNIEKALDGQQIVTCNDGETMSQAEKSMTDAEINEVGMLTDEAEETISEIRRSMENAEISIDEEEKKEVNDKEKAKLIGKAEEIENIVEMSDKTESLSNKAEESIDIMEEMRNKAENLIEPENSAVAEMSEMEEKVENETENLIDTTVTVNKIEKWINGTEKLTDEIEKTKNEMEIRLETKLDTTVDRVETSMEIIEEVEKKKSDEENDRSVNEESSDNDVEELVVKVHVHEDAQSINATLQNEDDQITETVVSENIKDETSRTNSSDEGNIDETQKKHEIDKSPTITSPLSAEIPFAYILSEGSPCEIPDSVTTVIIPDRPCLSPMNEESQQLESTNEKEESIIHDVDRKEEAQEKSEYGMELFGEEIQPEITSLPVDIDFMRGMKDAKSNIVIVHQDLDKIKEEGEEEEEEEEKKEKKDRVEEKEINISQEKNNKQRDFVQDETVKFTGTNLENIAEHEKNEEIDTIMSIEAKNVEEAISVDLAAYESLSDTTKLTDTSLIDDGRAEIILESRSILENSSEESGNTQDNHTTMSSDVKESTASNQSIENSSLSRPVVPELNLDSLQDNTVSSFKMTANNTTKEDNSPRESDATTSLIEPLISDERLMNQSILVNEEGVPVEQFTEDLSRDLQSAPEADQLYRAEHAEYEWLEKDLLCSEITLEDETKSREDSIDSMALPEDIVQVGPLLQEKEEEEQLNSEEEIARELIGSLNEEMEFCAKEVDTKEESKDSRESFKSDLAADDIANQVLSMSSTSIDEPKQKKCEFSLEELKKLDDKDLKSEVIIDELSTHIVNISQDDKNKEDTEDTEKSSLEEYKNLKEEKEEMTNAPLAQFEQDELLEPNNKTAEKMTIENKSNTTDIDSSDNQERYGNKETSIEEALENQEKKSTDKAKDLNQKQEENEQKEMQEENDQEKLKLEEEIVDTKAVSLETIESEKDSTNESIKNDKGPDKNGLINSDKSIVTEREVKDEKETTEEKTKDGENVQESVISAISEQSMENHPHGGYWATGTKSSTVETVIETISPNASTDKEVKADASEIIEDESFSTKKDDFYSAVIKIQACE
jgi:hypothetical protein